MPRYCIAEIVLRDDPNVPNNPNAKEGDFDWNRNPGQSWQPAFAGVCPGGSHGCLCDEKTGAPVLGWGVFRLTGTDKQIEAAIALPGVKAFSPKMTDKDASLEVLTLTERTDLVGNLIDTGIAQAVNYTKDTTVGKVLEDMVRIHEPLADMEKIPWP